MGSSETGGLYVLRIATRGIREYYIYFGGTANLGSALPRLQEYFPGYRIEFEIAHDAEWKRYVSCLP